LKRAKLFHKMFFMLHDVLLAREIIPVT